VKVKILPAALEDLDRGRRFYGRQGKDFGDYFLDALFSDIDSLELYAGVHMEVFDFHRQLEHGLLRINAAIQLVCRNLFAETSGTCRD